jgi:hypothetical protein
MGCEMSGENISNLPQYRKFYTIFIFITSGYQDFGLYSAIRGSSLIQIVLHGVI